MLYFWRSIPGVLLQYTTAYVNLILRNRIVVMLGSHKVPWRIIGPAVFTLYCGDIHISCLVPPRQVKVPASLSGQFHPSFVNDICHGGIRHRWHSCPGPDRNATCDECHHGRYHSRTKGGTGRRGTPAL